MKSKTPVTDKFEKGELPNVDDFIDSLDIQFEDYIGKYKEFLEVSIIAFALTKPSKEDAAKFRNKLKDIPIMFENMINSMIVKE